MPIVKQTGNDRQSVPQYQSGKCGPISVDAKISRPGKNKERPKMANQVARVSFGMNSV